MLTGRVNQLIRSYMDGESETAIQKEINRTKNEIIAPIFDKQPLEVYFPLTRAGQYGVSFKLHTDSAIAELNPHLTNTFEMYATYEEAQERIDALNKAVVDAEKARLAGKQTTEEAFFEAIDLSSISKSPIDTYKKDRQTDLYGPDPTITAAVFKKVMDLKKAEKTSQELRMLSSVTINCQVTKIVMNSGSQLSEL